MSPSTDTSDPCAGTARCAPGRVLWLKVVLGSCAAVVLLAGVGFFTYQMALARIPEHRAALERLVRARTGLDVRFNELALRWGWYGPEAVFSEVELGEPSRSSVLLRASALVVAFDAWRTLQTGQLQAGRVTLVSPDIDIERLRARPAPVSLPGAAVGATPQSGLARVPNGRLDVEGGTLSVPDPRHPDHALVLQIRSATLRRTAESWYASAYALLPERLGRSVRLTLRLQSPPQRPAELAGAVHLQAQGVQFASWRELLRPAAAAAQYLPSAGNGTLSLALDLRDGRVSQASGEVDADGVALEVPPVGPVALPGVPLELGVVRGAWTLARVSERAWHLDARRLAFGPGGRDMAPTSLSVDLLADAGSVRARLGAAPLAALRPAIAWLVPECNTHADPVLEGEAHELSVDWQAARPPGARLRLALRVADLKISGGAGLALEGVTARIAGSESQLFGELEGAAVRLALARSARPLAGLRLAARLELARTAHGWTLSAPRMLLQDAHGMLLAKGAVQLRPGDPATLALDATLAHGDAGALRAALGDEAQSWLGPVLAKLTAGRITRAEVRVRGRLGAAPLGARALNGFVRLEDGALAPSDSWPAVRGLSGRLEFRGREVRALVTAATSDALRLTSLKAQWRSAGPPQLRASAQAHGDIADVLAWLDTHRDLADAAPALRGVGAHGPVQLGFTVNAARPAGPPRVRLVARLDGVSVELAPRLPPLTNVRGSLAFEGTRLQRSTLEGLWLGGTAELRIAERASGLTVQAQGVLGARELVAAAALDARTLDIEGHAAWKGELTAAAATPGHPVSWHAHAESSLQGLTSALPAPLAKADGAALPLRLDVEAAGDTGVVRVALADLGRGVFELRAAHDGSYQVLRGAARFGAGALQLPESARIDVQGALGKLDLPAWLAAWRSLAPGATAPPLQAALTVDTLLLGSEAYGRAMLELHPELGADVLRIEAEELSGTLRFPRSGDGRDGEAHLRRARLPAGSSAGVGLAALAPAMRVSIDELTWQGRSLGALTARIASGAARLAVQDLRLSGANYAASGALDCTAARGACRLEFELRSGDAAASLRDFGFRPGLAAENATLSGTLQWPAVQGVPSSWLESATGHLSVALEEGAVLEAPAHDGRVFPLLGVPQLASGAGARAAAGLRFTRLTGEFELASGSALTSNLHLDGDAEILVSGRLGLIAHDYDCRAVILSAEERVPDAVRRLGPSAAPHVAAAWLALRDLWSSRSGESSRLQLHIGGTWERPVVALVH